MPSPVNRLREGAWLRLQNRESTPAQAAATCSKQIRPPAADRTDVRTGGYAVLVGIRLVRSAVRTQDSEALPLDASRDFAVAAWAGDRLDPRSAVLAG
jgi:hypothetical protein